MITRATASGKGASRWIVFLRNTIKVAIAAITKRLTKMHILVADAYAMHHKRICGDQN